MTTSAPTAWQLASDDEHCSPRTVAALVFGVLTTLYAVSLLLIARRMMGALTTELAWPALLVSALATFVIIAGTRIIWRRAFPEATIGDQWIGWGASLTLVLLAAGLSFPGHQQRDWLIWLPLLICDQILRRAFFGSKNLAALEIPFAQTSAARLSGDHLQQIVRVRDTDGHETIHAILRADFQTSQRNATVYVGFCPPLARMPKITIELSAGPAADFKIVQAFAHGARIDVRLAQIAMEPVSVVLNLIAKEVQHSQ